MWPEPHVIAVSDRSTAYLGKISDSDWRGIVNTEKDVPSPSVRIKGRPIAVLSRKVDRAATIVVDFRVTVHHRAQGSVTGVSSKG